MKPEFNHPKILAPVSSIEMANVVLESGADIIYAGEKGWSLRPDIFEVDSKELESIIQLALKHNKKIFLAMNCFYKSNEIPEALEKIRHWYSKGIRGVIISEIGLAALVRKMFPDLEVHISVQSSASSSVDIDFYKWMGATSVVLPRDMLDLSIDNIKGMAHRGVTLEVFAIGDDSSYYDGRCLLSGYLYQKAIPDESTGRDKTIIGNANRCGYCYLVCKRNCKTDGQAGKLLKRGDLPLYKQIPELIEAGVEVFKIQGREFPLPLVGKLISTFRDLLNNLDDPQKTSENVSTLDDLVELKQLIASNHLWLLAKSQSPIWKKMRIYLETPWDNITSSLWFKGESMKRILKKFNSFT